jgi:SAM-dependent methyltransferase
MHFMKVRALVHHPVRALVLCAFAACAAAQGPSAKEYQPEIGQAGKDVVWVPMPEEQLEKLLDMGKVTPADFVMDLGSGDGRTVIAAAKRGARAIGVEFDPDLVTFSRQRAAKAGVGDRAAFVEGDLFKTDLSRATVITLFLLDDINLKLRPALLSLKPGTRVLSNTFRMGDWEPDVSDWYPSGCYNWCALYLWIVPARVEGAWRTPEGELMLKQKYQTITGVFGGGAPERVVSGGRVLGEEIRFGSDGAEYRGRVNGNVIEGTVAENGSVRSWRATRALRVP